MTCAMPLISITAASPRAALALFFRAIECRAAGLRDAAHALGAGAAGTWLALFPIDRPAMLEIPELAIRLHIVAQRRATGFDCFCQHIADRLREARGARAGD